MDEPLGGTLGGFKGGFEMTNEQPHYYFHDPSAEPPRPDPDLDTETRLALEALVDAGFIVKVTFPEPSDPQALWELTVVRAGSDVGEWVSGTSILHAALQFASYTVPA